MTPAAIVKVYDLKTGVEEISRLIPLTPEWRAWLSRTIYWAVMNGKGVQVFNRDNENDAIRLAAG